MSRSQTRGKLMNTVEVLTALNEVKARIRIF